MLSVEADGECFTSQRREEAFAGLAREPSLLLAVSGGPDSMALMVLAASWASGKTPAPRLHVATVDHGLRVGSAGEAALVGGAAAALGLAHSCLRWEGPKPRTRVQERARATRYALLAAHARDIGASCILTAHHADDQAETVLMRLGRGSGIAGLAGMRRRTLLPGGIVLQRPLLGWSKAELLAVCRRQGVKFIEDPSNQDPAFARARLRRAAHQADALGLGRDALLRLSRRAAAAEDALFAATDAAEGRLAPRLDHGRCHVSLGRADLPDEVLLRLLRRWARLLNPDETARLERFERLVASMAANLRSGAPAMATLAGCRFDLGRNGDLTISREGARRSVLPRVLVELSRDEPSLPAHLASERVTPTLPVVAGADFDVSA